MIVCSIEISYLNMVLETLDNDLAALFYDARDARNGYFEGSCHL
jgi:hypothetical protein